MVLAPFASGCGGSRGAATVPVPSVSSSLPAQTAFRRLEARFSDLPPEERPGLEPELRAFLKAHGEDDRSRLARLYLGWVLLDQKRGAEVHALAAQVRSGPKGAAHDFADVVEAAALRRDGWVGRALGLLEPLRGKIANPVERALYSEELVRALVDRRRFEDAIFAMLDWAEQAPPTDRDTVVASIEGILRGMPSAALETDLAVLARGGSGSASPETATRAEARRWLQSAARGDLVRVALTQQNPNLARRLVESSTLRLGHDDTKEALEALASTGAVAPRVAGRAVGVVLDVADETSRSRSADTVAGMTRALGLPITAASADAVRLVTRDAAEEGDVERALGSLAGDGAAILVAGVTDGAAASASLFAEREKIPVIVLQRPPGSGGSKPFTFVLGPDAAALEEALTVALASGSAKSPARVGTGGIPCDAASRAPGEPQFPTREWKHGGTDALVLLGDEACARDALAEAGAAGLRPLVVVGLEAASADLPGSRLVVSGGRFPFGTHPLSTDEQSWVDRWGAAPSWYEALGHDAALLAAAVLAAFPLDRADDRAAVRTLHARARDGLARARGKLWTTEASGFASGTVMARRLQALPLSGASRVP